MILVHISRRNELVPVSTSLAEYAQQTKYKQLDEIQHTLVYCENNGEDSCIRSRPKIGKVQINCTSDKKLQKLKKAEKW